MQKWEHLHVVYTGPMYTPAQITVWPSGVIDLEWLNQRFGVRIRKTDGLDIIDKLFQNAPHVSKALIQYLGFNGWEAVVYYPNGVFFKRPLQDNDQGKD